MSGEIIRAETDADIAAIRALHEASFPGAAEARLVDRLRDGGWLVLSLLAERDGALIAHVAFSRLAVRGPSLRAVALAPVSTAPARRRRGVADRLIRAAHARLAAAGEAMSFVLGDPAYYGRFDYDATLAARFSCAYAGRALQALALDGEATAGGELVYPPPFADM
jgi:putative acetyltransferase